MAEGGEHLWQPKVWDDLAEQLESAEAADGEDSDGDATSNDAPAVKLEVILEEPPEGLELCSATPSGHGAVVTQCSQKVAQAGMGPGTSILSIDARSVEDVPTEEIRRSLSDASLPVAVGVKPMMHLPKAKKMKTRTKDPVTVCTAHCRGSYRAVKEAVAQLGWREVTMENRECSVVWLEHSDTSEGIAPVQTVTRLDAFLHMCRKAPLARCLNCWIEELPDDFTFVPQTWVLPNDAAVLEATMARGKCTYIAKPSAGTQGKGIVLAKKWSDLSEVVSKAQGSKDLAGKMPTEYVVQRYIAKPLLLDGLKFDMRIYVIVTSVVPLRAYLFKEGLARFCTVPYQAPKDGNLRDVCMHLTNFAVNKQSKDFQASEGLENHDEGSKRSISSVFWEIERAHGVSVAELWGKVAALTANTLMALRPGLLEHYVQQDVKRPRALHPLAPKGFQIIGLDVLLDSNLEPQLIELNANPSLSVLQPGRSLPKEPCAGNATADVPADVQAEDGSPESYAAGSALQAVRMASRSSSPKVQAQPADASFGTAADTELGDASEHEAAIARVMRKLQLLSPEDFSTAEAFIDTLIPSAEVELAKTAENSSAQSAAANTPRTRGQSPAANSERTRGQARSARQTSASPGRHTSGSPARQNATTPDIASVSTSASSERGRQSSISPETSVSVGASKPDRRSLTMQSRQRLGLSKSGQQDKPPKEHKMVTSPLDLAIKKELISQALLLAKPAPQCKVARLRKQWFNEDQDLSETIPLDDEGDLVRPDLPMEVRADAPERCPCLEALDFDDLVLPEVTEYARAHYALYRTWVRSCAPGQSTVGQAQMQKLLERRGFVGPGLLFEDRLTAQLWLTKVWRLAADGAFGVDIGQFVRLASRLGLMLRGAAEGEGGAEFENVAVGGVLEFVRHGGAGAD